MGIIFTFLMGHFMSFESITDNDYFWHVVIGRWIDTNHAIPNRPLFSWWGMQSDLSWTSHEWLTEWIMYKLGDAGCIAIMLTIFFLLYVLMAKLLKVKFNKIFDVKLIYLLLMTIFFKVTGPRPYIISLLFFAYLLYVLFGYLDNKKKFNKLIWTLPIMQVLWANLHGGSSSLPYVFIIGILLSDLFIKIFKINNDRFTSYKLNNKQIKTLLINLVLIMIATCISPTGYKLLIYPFTNMTDTNMIDLILEWQSPSFHGFLGLYIFIMIGVPLFNMIFYKGKFKFYDIALFLLMFYMALKSQRFIGMFGIYSTHILGEYLFFTDKTYDIIKKPFKKFEVLIKYSFIILLILILGLTGYKQISNFKLVDNHGFYSDEAVKKIIELKPKKMYNDFGAGGYLLYKLSEYNSLDTEIFIYGLGDVFSNNILPDSLNLYGVRNPDKYIEKYDFDVMLTVSTSPLRYYLEKCSDWKIYYSDDMNYIFVKA